MKVSTIVTIVVIAVIVLGGVYWLMQGQGTTPTPSTDTTQTSSDVTVPPPTDATQTPPATPDTSGTQTGY